MRRLNTASVLQALDVKRRETLRQLVKRGLLKRPITDDGVVATIGLSPTYRTICRAWPISAITMLNNGNRWQRESRGAN